MNVCICICTSKMKIEQLISAVFARNSLWDQNDSSHRNRFVLDKLWDEVAMEMGSTREAVRSKWKTLRDTYRRELQKIAKASEIDGPKDAVISRSSNYTHLRSWTYFKSLSFLRDQFEMGRFANFEYSEPSFNRQYKRKASESPIVDDPEPDTSMESKQEKIQKLEGKNDINEDETPDDDEEDMHFFKSLLPHVKRLSPQQKMLLRLRLQEVVYDFVYAECTRTEAQAPDTYPSSNVEYSLKYLSE